MGKSAANKVKLYKIVYSVAWIIIGLFVFIVGSLLIIADPKAVGVLALYYSPTWLPVMVLCVLSVIYSNKLIRIYENQR